MEVEYDAIFRVLNHDVDDLNIDDENSDDNMDGLHIVIVCLSHIQRS